MNDQQKLLDQLKKMNALSMEKMMNDLRSKMLDKKLKKQSQTMLTNFESQLPAITETNANSGSTLDDLMGLLNKISE